MKNGAVGVSLPSRSHCLLVAVVRRVGYDEVVIAHHIRCARDGEHVVVGGDEVIGLGLGELPKAEGLGLPGMTCGGPLALRPVGYAP